MVMILNSSRGLSSLTAEIINFGNFGGGVCVWVGWWATPIQSLNKYDCYF